MLLKMPAARFASLAKRVLAFATIGQGPSPGLNLVRAQVTDEGVLRVTAQNAISGVRVLDRVREWEAGEVAFAFPHLDKVSAIMPGEGELVMTSNGGQLTVRVGRLRLRLPVASADDCAVFPQPSTSWLEIDSHRVSRVVKNCVWATHTGDMRPVLSGVHLHPQAIEATDGHVMSQLVPGFAGGDCIVPALFWQRLQSLLVPGHRMSMAIGDNRIWFHDRMWLAYGVLVAGDFPATDDIVFDVDGDNIHFVGRDPKKVNSIIINRHSLLDIAKRIAGAAIEREENKVGTAAALDMREGGELHVVSRYSLDDVSNCIHVDEGLDWVEGSVTTIDLSPFTWFKDVAFHSQYMVRALSSLVSETVKMMWIGAPMLGNLPLQFHDDGEGIRALIMPRRI